MKIGVDTSGYRALRRHRISSPNQIYLITFTTGKRQAIFFENDLAARAFCVALNDPRLWQEAELMCWVLMPDHVHLLVQIGDKESISQLINRLKTNAKLRTLHIENAHRRVSLGLIEPSNERRKS